MGFFPHQPQNEVLALEQPCLAEAPAWRFGMTQTNYPAPLWQRLLIGRKPKRTLFRAAILAVAGPLFFLYVLRPVRIEGVSMEPAYHNQTIHFINRLAYWRAQPRRGDVVAIKTTGIGNLFLKRVIGLPGETVRIKSGQVVINDREVAEPYVVYKQPWEYPARSLGLDECLVIGDNRDMPQEMHSWGVVKLGQIAGKAAW